MDGLFIFFFLLVVGIIALAKWVLMLKEEIAELKEFIRIQEETLKWIEQFENK